MLASEPMQIDISPPSEMEIISKVDCLKNHKASGPGRLSPSSLKMKFSLQKICGSCIAHTHRTIAFLYAVVRDR